MSENKFDTIFKSKLEQHQTPVKVDFWNQIETGLEVNPKANFIAMGSKALGIIASGAILGVSVYFAISLDKKEKNKEQIAAPIVTNSPSKTDDNKESKQSETIKKVSKKLKDNQIVVSHSSIADKAIDENNLSTTKQNDQNLNNTTKSIEAVSISKNTTTESKLQGEKEYRAGERVYMKFDFTKEISTKQRKAMCWVDLPTWVDMTTVKTESHSENITTLKTNVDSRFKSIEWVAVGDFEKTTEANKVSFIEYSFEIKENKKESELKKIKPEVK